MSNQPVQDRSFCGAVCHAGVVGLREAVLAGPAGETPAAAVAGTNPLRVVASPDRVRAALAAAGHTDQRCRLLTGTVTTVLILGLCLFGGAGTRWYWPGCGPCSRRSTRLW